MFFRSPRPHRIKLKYLPTESILPNPFGARRQEDSAGDSALCESIRRVGILEPLAVMQDGADFLLLSGERRLRAARTVGLPLVPCNILPFSKQLPFLHPLSRHIHRRDLDPFEKGTALRQMMDTHRLSRGAAASLLGLRESAVGGFLSVLRLNDGQRHRSVAANLSKEHITAISRADASLRDRVLDAVISKRLSPEDTQQLVSNLPNPQKAEEKPHGKTQGVGDVRLFGNSLGRLVESLTSSGIKASHTRRETESFIEYTVKIYRPESREKADKQLALF